VSSRPPAPRETGSALGAVCALLSLAVPLVITALRVTPSPEWRDDLAIVRSLGFVPVGGEGVPSALLAELAALLPVGGRVLRAGLVGALGAAVSGRLLYSLAFDLLGRHARTPSLSPPLALAAALTATLSPTFQHEGTAAGGATCAVALGLAAILAHTRSRPGAFRHGLAVGALVGLTLAESHVAAAAVGAALLLGTLVSGLVPTRQAALAMAAGAVLVAGFCLLPFFVRPFAEHGWVTLGIEPLVSAGPAAPAFRRLGPLSTWASEMGPLALALGLAGLAVGLVRAPSRPGTSALAAFVVADALLPARGQSALVADRFAPVTLLAVSALAVAAVVGVQTASLALRRAKIPLAMPAAVLLVVFHFTLVFAAAETSSSVVTDMTGLGADVWTDEALGEVPSSSIVLVRSPAIAFRLWAARAARGERPDLVVVPLGLVGRGTVAATLVREEPAVAPLIRDVAITGKASEYSLAALADARPLYVELDPSWDKRLLEHLLPTPLWLAFTAHTLGRSDRNAALSEEDGRRALRRILGVARQPERDTATLSVLGARAKEQAVVLAALGDRDSARHALSALERIEPGSAFATKLERELESHSAVDPRPLLE